MDIIAVLDNNGAVVVKYFYDAWGDHTVVDNRGAGIADTESVAHLNPEVINGLNLYAYRVLSDLINKGISVSAQMSLNSYA